MRLATLRAKHAALAPVFTERSRRLWAASEARALGHGGIDVVERATGIARATIQRGLRELETGTSVPPGRTRRPGGGRKSATVLDVTLLRDLDALVEPTAPGGPDSPLRWSCKSTRTLAVALQAWATRSATPSSPSCCTSWATPSKATSRRGKAVSIPTAMRSFGISPPRSSAAQRRGQPAISVDTKKKELVGDFKNARPGVAAPRATRSASACTTS